MAAVTSLGGVAVIAPQAQSGLVADVQYLEQFGSSALNRKVHGIILPGIYRGFSVAPGDGLAVSVVPGGNLSGVASVDVDNYQVTVQLLTPLDVKVAAGKMNIVILEAVYGQGIVTTQVSSAATQEAAKLSVVNADAEIPANAIEIARVNVPAGATSITAPMIDTTKRYRYRLSLEPTDDIGDQREARVLTVKAGKSLVSNEAFTKKLEEYAKKGGDAANAFSVKDASADAHAVNLAHLTQKLAGYEKTGQAMLIKEFAYSGFASEMGIRRVLVGSNPPPAAGVWTVANSTWTPLPYGGLFYSTNGADLSVGSAGGRFNNYIFIGYGNVGDPVIYYATDVNGRFSGWAKSYTTNSKPSASDVDAWSKDESNDRFAYKSITVNGKPLSSNVNLGADDVNAWNKTESDGRFIYSTGDKIKWLDITDGLAVGKNVVVGSDLVVGGMDYITKRGNITNPDGSTRQTNGLRLSGSSDLFADIYHYEKVGHYHSLGFHIANGGNHGWFDFRNDGSFYAGATIGAGNARLFTDGNISGDKWGGYLSDWLWREFNARDNNINNRATWDYVNSRSSVWGGRSSWWHKDEVTGFIIQGGVINRSDYYTRVGFPRGFTRECFGVQLTLANSGGGWAGESRVNIQPRDLDSNGFNVFMDGNEQSVYWEAKGI